MDKRTFRKRKAKTPKKSLSYFTITNKNIFGSNKIEVDIPEDRDKEIALAKSLYSEANQSISRETFIRQFGIDVVEMLEKNNFDDDFGFLQIEKHRKNTQTFDDKENLDGNVIPDTSDSDDYSENMLLSTFYKKFKDNNMDDRDGQRWIARTAFDYDTVIHIYKEHIGGDLQLHKIKPRMHLDFQDVLRKLPSNRNKKRKYIGKSIKELMKMDIDKTDLMAISTINNYTRKINTITSEMRRLMVAKLPILQPITTSKREARVPYTREDIESILQHKTFKNNKYKYPYQFWLVPIAIYTGCRLREICQLEKNDIQKCSKTNTWYFDINDKPSPAAQKTKVVKHLKNRTSVRRIPIHQHLIELGFLDFINHSRDSNEYPYLFNINPNQQGDCSASVSKWYQRINNSIDLDRSNGDKVFHSFRHTFVSSLSELGHREMDINDLAGHSQNTTSTKVYKSTDLGLLSNVINSLDFRKELCSIDPWNET